GGIRDYKVTGVQTCALPISGPISNRPKNGFGSKPISCAPWVLRAIRGSYGMWTKATTWALSVSSKNGSKARHWGNYSETSRPMRSEERRVGKELGSWMYTEH